jgi:exodeoxyribonuclease-1
VRATKPEQLAERAAQGKLAFQDGRLDELVFRWRARNFPASLTADEAERWQAHCGARLHEGEGGALTLAAFMERIDQLGEAADERGEEILAALYDYAEQIAP